MTRVRLFLGLRDRAFAERLKGLAETVEIAGESTSLKAIAEGADLLFVDRIPSRGFIHLKPKVVIVALRALRYDWTFIREATGQVNRVTKKAQKSRVGLCPTKSNALGRLPSVALVRITECSHWAFIREATGQVNKVTRKSEGERQ